MYVRYMVDFFILSFVHWHEKDTSRHSGVQIGGLLLRKMECVRERRRLEMEILLIFLKKKEREYT